MPQKPDDGDDPKPGAAHKSAPRGRTSRPKSAIAIDLPADAVREVNEAPVPEAPPSTRSGEAGPDHPSAGNMPGDGQDAPPSPSLPPSPAPAPEPRRGLAPALIALAAGLTGGAVGGVLADRLAPVPASEPVSARVEAVERRLAALPPAAPASLEPLATRIAGVEARLDEGSGGIAALREELSRLTRESAERAAAIEALARRPAPAGGGDNAALTARLAALEAAGKALAERIEALAGAIRALEARHAMRTAGEAIGRAQARLAALALVEAAFRAGRPFAAPLDLLAKSGVEAARLDALRPFAESGAPGARKLAEELRAARPKAGQAAPAEGSALDRLRASALSLVEIRKAGEATGSDDAAHLARAEQALAREDIAAAILAIGRLSPAAAPAHAAWLKRAGARQQAEAALAALGGEALAALAAAAGGQ